MLKKIPKSLAKRLQHRLQHKQSWPTYTGAARIFRTSPTIEHKELLHPLLPDVVEYTKKLSIIFGTYNRLGMLQRCIASIRSACVGRTYEIIVCDGGSSDGSRQWLQEQPDVVLVLGDLSGAVRAFNACFERVTGQYTIALNDDAAVFPTTFTQALRYFDDPLVGQVAFYYHENNKWQVQHTHNHVYANYAMTRTHVAKTIATICGGYWATCYQTYGGDTELSCWVYRLGYKVVEAPDACVDHFEAMDELRRKNIAGDQARRGYYHRWPNAEVLKFRGPLPGVPMHEMRRLSLVETGEMPEARWERIALVDPKPGEFPPIAEPRAERVLHYHLWTEEDPQNALASAMQALGNIGHTRIDWPSIPAPQRAAHFEQAVKELQPTVVFLQLQSADALDLGVIARARRQAHDPSLVVVAWSGDVGPTNGPWAGFSDAWSYELAKHVDLMLYTGTGQAEMHRARGMKNAAYLQIGYDEDRYCPGPLGDYGSRHEVVFLGQNYGAYFDPIPGNEVQLRRDLVDAFQRNFSSFGVYGGGWLRGQGHAHQTSVGDILRHSALALSVSLTSSLGRYSSDRLIRSMACGTPTLVKRFVDMEGWGLKDGVNCIVFDTVGEAVEKANHWLAHARREERLAIGMAGAELMKTRHTWSYRLRELAALLKAVRGQR